MDSTTALPSPLDSFLIHSTRTLPSFAYTLPFTYNYAASPVADIHLYEPNSTGNLVPSDLLRFTRDPNGPNTLLFFYSDASVPGDPPDAPADVLALPNPVFLYTSAAEIGLFGNPYSEAGPNGFVYGLPWARWDGMATQMERNTRLSVTALFVPNPARWRCSRAASGFSAGSSCSGEKFSRERAQRVSTGEKLTTAKRYGIGEPDLKIRLAEEPAPTID